MLWSCESVDQNVAEEVIVEDAADNNPDGAGAIPKGRIYFAFANGDSFSY